MAIISNRVSKDEFNITLKSAVVSSGISDIKTNLDAIALQQKSLNFTVLGKSTSQTISGIESQSCTTDRPDGAVAGTGICRINKGVPGFSAELTTRPAKKVQIAAITGSASASANLTNIVCCNSPVSINTNLNVELGKKPSGDVLSTITIPTLASSLKANINSTDAISASFDLQLASLTLSINAITNKNSGGIFSNILVNANDALRAEIVKITNGLLEENNVNAVINQMLEGNPEAAARTIRVVLSSKGVTLDEISTIEQSVYNVNIASSSIISNNSGELANIGKSTSNVEQLNSSEQNYPENQEVSKNSGTNGFTFTYVESYEELIADIRGANRDITEVVVHWTAHFNNQGQVGSEELHNIGVQRGFSGNSYHYVIKKDGRLQRGRPLNKIGAHAKENGHNRYSIGIGIVGGYNCNSNNPNYRDFISAESITGEQWSTVDQFLTAFYAVHPGGQVWGHNDTNPERVDPGIDMQQYIKNKFDRTNKSSSGQLPPLSPAEIAIG